MGDEDTSTTVHEPREPVPREHFYTGITGRKYSENGEVRVWVRLADSLEPITVLQAEAVVSSKSRYYVTRYEKKSTVVFLKALCVPF
jgi:hypothetical protein